MPEPVLFAIAAALAVAGWAFSVKLKLPASAFLGPLLFVGAAAVVGVPQPVYPAWSLMLFQVTFGAFLGCQADRDSVARVRALGAPIALATAWTIVSAFALALLLAALTRLDMASAFLSAVPGGVAEMSALSISMGANTVIVAAMQSLRVIATMGTIPMLSQRLVTARARAAAAVAAEPVEPYLVDDVPVRGHLWSGNHVTGWLASLAVALVGGLVFSYFRVPAAGILGSMALVTAGRLAGLGLTKPPPGLRIMALIGLGSYVGTTFSAVTLMELGSIAFPAILVTLATVGSGLALAGVLQRRFNMDAPTALLACAPAGVSQMAVIADELGGDVLVVTLFQLIRVMCCVFILPVIYAMLV